MILTTLPWSGQMRIKSFKMSCGAAEFGISAASTSSARFIIRFVYIYDIYEVC